MYTAIITPQLRDVKTTTPKILLLDVHDENGLFRSHCWVNLTPELEELRPKHFHKSPIKISFTAKPFDYVNHFTSEVKQSLKKVKNVALI